MEKNYLDSRRNGTQIRKTTKELGLTVDGLTKKGSKYFKIIDEGKDKVSSIKKKLDKLYECYLTEVEINLCKKAVLEEKIRYIQDISKRIPLMTAIQTAKKDFQETKRMIEDIFTLQRQYGSYIISMN
jgi:hypothetical protein